MTIEERINCPKCKSQMVDHDDFYKGQIYVCASCNVSYTQSDFDYYELLNNYNKKSEALRKERAAREIAVKKFNEIKEMYDDPLGSMREMKYLADQALTKIEEVLK
jgi:DNA-directed RNA polymerase subunit M/transcription elongation factor TFIIS